MPRQLLVLPPGDYVLQGQVRSDGDGDGLQLGWFVSCAEDARVLARVGAPAPSHGVWSPFAGAFKVPGDGCTGQWLQLEAAPGERRASVMMWYDKLTIRPAQPGSPP